MITKKGEDVSSREVRLDEGSKNCDERMKSEFRPQEDESWKRILRSV